MKKLIILLSLLLLGGPVLADEKADVQKAQDGFIQARLKADFTKLEQVLTPDFLCVTHNGRFLDKAQFLAYAKERTMGKLDLKAPKIRVNGNMAVVTAQGVAAGNHPKEGGKFSQDKTAITYVWLKTAQGWKLNSLHWHFY